MREIASSLAAVPSSAAALYPNLQPCFDHKRTFDATTTKPSNYATAGAISATPQTGYTGRYTQADPIGLQGQDMNLYRYALADPTTYIDPLGLDVRVCCRKFDAPKLNKYFDHCYIESNKGGSRHTWGLYGRFTKDGFVGVPNADDKADVEKPNNNRRCGQWHKDCSGCLDLAMKNYPIEDYSVAEAPLGVGSGRNSNTFVRCMFKKCLPYVANPFHTDNAAGWDQPCPSTSNF